MFSNVQSAGRGKIGLVSLALLATSCGDGGSPPPPPPPPASAKPVFSSSTSASVVENTSGAFYTAAASNARGTGISIALVGGADLGKFELVTGGQIRFVNPPNFEKPADADTDNVYDLVVRATAASGEITDLALAVNVTNDKEGIAVKRASADWGTDAVIMASPQQEGIFIALQDGSTYRVTEGGTVRTKVADAFFAGETGRVLSLGYLNDHVMVLLKIPGKGVLVRAFPLVTTPHSYLEVQLAVDSPMNVDGQLFTASGGLLWAAVGDPSGDVAQNGASGYGKLHRVQAYPNCGAAITGIWCIFKETMGDGVHAPGGGGTTELPWTFLIDRGTDRRDEITMFDPEWRPLDFGWPNYEGDEAIRSGAPAAVNGPSLTVARSDGFHGTSGLVGGAAYKGSIEQLRGKLVFGDIGGKVFAFPYALLTDGSLHRGNEVENRTKDFEPDQGAIDAVRGIVVDQAGTLYILDADGELFRVDQS